MHAVFSGLRGGIAGQPEPAAFLFAKGLYDNLDGIQNQSKQYYGQEKQLEIAEQVYDDRIFPLKKGRDICKKFWMDERKAGQPPDAENR